MNEQQQLQKARQLIERKEFVKAYQVLQTIPLNPTAQKWMVKLNEMGVIPPPKKKSSFKRLLYITAGGVLSCCCLFVALAIIFPSSALPSATQTVEARTEVAVQNATASIIALTPTDTPTITPTATITLTPSETPITPTSTPDTANPASGTRYITAVNLNVRSGAGAGYDILGTLQQSDAITVTGELDGWYRIDYEGREGWVSGQFTSLELQPTTVPTSEPIEFDEDAVLSLIHLTMISADFGLDRIDMNSRTLIVDAPEMVRGYEDELDYRFSFMGALTGAVIAAYRQPETTAVPPARIRVNFNDDSYTLLRVEFTYQNAQNFYDERITPEDFILTWVITELP